MINLYLANKLDRFTGDVAQLVERRTVNPQVMGSNPLFSAKVSLAERYRTFAR